MGVGVQAARGGREKIEMKEQITAVMQSDFLTLHSEMPIRHAAGLLHSSGQAAAPVVDDSGVLIGILTQKDCFRPAMYAAYYQQWRGTVKEQMSCPVMTIDSDVDLVAAAEKFLAEPHRAFPVIESGKLIGMLRREDVLRRFLELG